MKVRECMTPAVAAVSADSTLQVAAANMRDNDIGMLPVHENNAVVGVVTDRDIAVRAVAQGDDPQATPIRTCMTRDLTTCVDEDDAQAAAETMKKKQLRRLLVVDTDRKPVGVVALGDLARHSESAPLAREALAGVCQPVA